MSSTARLFIAALDDGDCSTFQYCAIASCSSVRVSEMRRTSARASRDSVEPKIGGGSGRDSSADERKNGRAPRLPRAIGPPFQSQCPGPVGGVPGFVTPKLSLSEYATTRPP